MNGRSEMLTAHEAVVKRKGRYERSSHSRVGTRSYTTVAVWWESGEKLALGRI